ncbi:hypothetical protein HYE82_33955 [Streptomyces sp. BR123]|uniref:hypothetical protein n=1 Tax=Streptomyces sp. BR123 TaxID=2749828 RepID=UPI0015C45469|nr:hypothetical protein [Streptomyces sp. BR123]NXY99296.1 hypothetical protein [Streptomyces sp. BR123]
MLLREDHRTVAKLFKRFEKTSGGDTAERRNIAHGVTEELEAGKKETPRDPLAVPGTASK